jgi:glycosyltransferase involved in cell wall biosynthesis
LERIKENIQKPVISVLLPVFNGQQHITAAIDSILSQSFTDLELIIVDDCSTDNTISIIENYTDKRIRLFRNDQNSGPGISLNNGIEKVEGSFIAIMHADDISTADRLEKQYKFFQTHPDIDIVGTQFKQMNEEGVVKMERSNLPLDPNVLKYSTLFNNCLCHPSVMIRKTVFDSGIRYESLRVNEDYALWITCLTKGIRIANLDFACLHYRIHESQASSKFAKQENESFSALRMQYVNSMPLPVQALMSSIESVTTQNINSIVEQIKAIDVPKHVKTIFLNRLSFYIHSLVKEKVNTQFSLKKYFEFLNRAGWVNIKAAILYRLLLNRSF